MNIVNFKVKKNMYVECFRGMSSGSMYVKKGSEFEGEFVDEMYGGKKGYYVVDDDYFGDICFMKSDVKIV